MWGTLGLSHFDVDIFLLCCLYTAFVYKKSLLFSLILYTFKNNSQTYDTHSYKMFKN